MTTSRFYASGRPEYGPGAYDPAMTALRLTRETFQQRLASVTYVPTAWFTHVTRPAYVQGFNVPLGKEPMQDYVILRYYAPDSRVDPTLTELHGENLYDADDNGESHHLAMTHHRAVEVSVPLRVSVIMMEDANLSDLALTRIIRAVINEADKHEMMEFLRINGERIYAPHPTPPRPDFDALNAKLSLYRKVNEDAAILMRRLTEVQEEAE